MHLLNVKIVKWVVTLIFLFFSLLSGQEREKKASISRISAPPRIDGRLDDPCWREIQPVSAFVQYDPINGAPASEETSVWMAYDSKNLYFAFLMKDSQPKKIWAELTPRNAYEDNDSITVILDTYNDRRTSFSFTVNAKGVQKNSVETIWKSRATVIEDGWTAEIAIPFKSLRFSTDAEQVWGINFQRFINRLNETDFWTRVLRDRPLLQQMGEASGLSGIRPGRNIELFPYVGVRSTKWEDALDEKVAGGLDFKYGIASNLVLDLTASPDFSEVQSDPFIYQLSPFENYLYEYRPFFNEGSQYFNLATEGGEGGGFFGPSYKLFYSRRIQNPKIAAKLTGKTGGYSFGILGAKNDEGKGRDAAFSVFRIQKDIFANSQLGFYYSGFDARGEHNHNAAIDYNFNFKDIYYIRGANIFTFDKASGNRARGLHFLQVEKEADAGLTWNFNFRRIDKQASMRTGFVTETDIQHSSLTLGYAWRFNRGKVKHLEIMVDGNLDQNCAWKSTGRSFEASGWIDFTSRMMVEFMLNTGNRRYQVAAENGDFAWTDDFLRNNGANVGLMWFRGGFLKGFRLEAGWQKCGVYTDGFRQVEPGSQYGLEGSLILRPRSNIEVSLGVDWTRQTLERSGETVFNGFTYDAALHFQFTPSFFMATNLKGETRENQYNLDFLLGYYFGAGNIVQLAFKKNARNEEGLKQSGYSITLKVSYLLRM